MRRKINESKAIFDEIYNVYKNVKPKCKGKIANHTVKKKRSDIRKLEKYADKLFQEAGKKLYPVSVVETRLPTEVIHHFIPKSQSNNLRYDFKNACPATNGQHFRYHTCGDPMLTNAFIRDRGQEWIDDLEVRRHIVVKQTKERLEAVIVELETIIYGKPKSLPF
jgi:hypothetical protein